MSPPLHLTIPPMGAARGTARRESNLLLEVIEAKDLRVDTINGCDPYVTVLLDHKEESRTRTVWASSDPHWHHEVYMPLTHDHRQLDLVVWDENRRTKDVPLGKVSFTREFLRNQRKQIEQWFPLASAATEGTVSGDICLELRFKPAEAPTGSHTLTVNVVAGRDLVSRDSNGLSDPYIVLHFLPDPDAETTKRTQVHMKTLDPKFNESFTFTFKGSLHERQLHVSVWDWDRFTDDDFMGHLYVPLADLPDDAPVEKWYPVLPQPVAVKIASDSESHILSIFKPSLHKRNSRKDSHKDKAHLAKEPDVHKGRNFVRALQSLPKDTQNVIDKSNGSLRLKIRYLEELVLSRDTYSDMIQLTAASHFLIPTSLGKWADSREDVARSLVKIFDDLGQAQEFLQDVITTEVMATFDANTIFRGNSMATKGLDVFMKSCAWEYLNAVLGGLVKEIMTSKKSCEVDPTRLEKNESVEKNFKNLEHFVVTTIHTILGSASMCPRPLCELFGHIRQQVLLKFNNNMMVAHTAVSGFIFLRFFCPAILAPKLFGLWPDHADGKMARTLTLVAKTIQNLGNLVEFGYKEEYMKGMNSVITANIDGVKKYLDDISIPPSPPNKALKRRTLNWEKTVEKAVDFERECSRLFTYYQLTLSRMRENATAEELPMIMRLENVLDGIQTHYEREEMLLGPTTPRLLTPSLRAQGNAPNMPVPAPPKGMSLARPEYDSLPSMPNQSVAVGHAFAFTMKPNTLNVLDDLIGDLEDFSLATVKAAPTPAAAPKTSASVAPLNDLISDLESFKFQPAGAADNSAVQAKRVSGPAPAAAPAVVPAPAKPAAAPAPAKPAAAPAPAPAKAAPAPAKAVPAPVPAPVQPAANKLSQLDDLLADLAVASSGSVPEITIDNDASSNSMDDLVAKTAQAAKRASRAVEMQRLSASVTPEPAKTPSPGPIAERKDDRGALDDLLDDFDTAAHEAMVANEAELGKKCLYCMDPIQDLDEVTGYISWAGYKWHHDHFRCSVCNDNLQGAKFFFHDLKLFCSKDYEHSFVCTSCKLPIHDQMIEAFDKRWHASCFRCTDCDQQLTGSFLMVDGDLLCRGDYLLRAGMRCALCSNEIADEYVMIGGSKYHSTCLKCKECGQELAGREYTAVNDDMYCATHFDCHVCGKRLTSQIVAALNHRYHVECFACFSCHKPLIGQTFYGRNDQAYCKSCYES